MRSALRGTEVIPPADGWARLERELALSVTNHTFFK